VVDRIVKGAAEQFHRKGLHGAGLDDVLDAAQVGRGQFYRYFESRDELVPLVLEHQVDAWLARHAAQLGDLASIEGIERFAASLASAAGRLRRWCPIGVLAADVINDPARTHRAAAGNAFRRMAAHLAAGLATMQRDGRLAADADPERLARMFVACFEGGLLVAIATDDERPLRDALDAALGSLRAAAN
jgi:AcrR family transcriptional regulator